MYENPQQQTKRVGSSMRQTTTSPNTSHSQINKERVTVSSLRKKTAPTTNENTLSIRTSKTKLYKYKENLTDEEDQHDEEEYEDEYMEDENTDMESPVMIDSCHEQQGNKKVIKPAAIFSSLREMQAEMKSLSSIQDDLLQSSHDENSDISVLIEDEEEIKPSKKTIINRKQDVVEEEYCETEEDQIENTDIEEEEEYLPKKPTVVAKPVIGSVNQLLEKHRRENEERKKLGTTPFTFDDISHCSDDETTQIELTETEDNVNTHQPTRAISVKASTESNKIPKTIISEIAQQVISENQSQKKPVPNVTFASPEPSDVSPIIAPKLTKEQSQQQIKKQRPVNNQQRKQIERTEDDRVRVEKKKRDFEKDVLLRDYERRLSSLSNKVVEYEALLEAHEERTSTIEREKDLELQALRGLYEEKWIEFKQKEKEWNERIITSCNESADLSSKTKKQNEQLLQLRQKLQSKTEEANQLQKTLKDRETEWKEKEKSYVNIRKRYDELLNHSREIKKNAEQLGIEVNDLRKYNEELTQKIDETAKSHKVKSKELKEKNEKLTIQIQQQNDTLEALSKKIEEERRGYSEKEEKIKELERESKDMARNYQELRQTLVNLSNEKENIILQEEEKYNQRVKELLKSENQLREQKLESEKRIEEYEAKFLNLKKTVEEQLDQYKLKYEEERKRSKKLQLIAEKQKSKFSEEYEKLKDQIMKREKMFEEKISELRKIVENEKKEKERLQRRCEHLESINNVMKPSPNINGSRTRESSKSRDSEVRETSDSIKPLFRKAEPKVSSPKLNETTQSQTEDSSNSSDETDSDTDSSLESECGSSCSTIKRKKRRFKKAVEDFSKQKTNHSPNLSHLPTKDQKKDETEFNVSSTIVVRRKKEDISQLEISGAEDTDTSNTHSITRLKDFEKLQEECNNEFKDYKQKMMDLMKDINYHGKELGQLRSLVKNTTPALSKQPPNKPRAPSVESKKKKVLKSGSPLKKKK